MAKKKTIELNNAEPLRDLPTSGVMVSYKHQTIAASDETAEYALLTRGKKCEANIEVTYIRPAESDKFPFIIPVNFDPSSPLSGTVAFDSDKSADAMTALRAGRPICVQLVGAEHNLAPVSGISCFSMADYEDTNPDHWDAILNVEANLIEGSAGAITSIGVMRIDLSHNTWTASMKLFN